MRWSHRIEETGFSTKKHLQGVDKCVTHFNTIALNLKCRTPEANLHQNKRKRHHVKPAMSLRWQVDLSVIFYSEERCHETSR